MRRIALLIWLLMLSAAIAAEPHDPIIVGERIIVGEVTARLSVTVADPEDAGKIPVVMNVEVEGPKGLVVDGVTLKDPVGGWEAKLKPEVKSGDEQRSIWTQEILLTPNKKKEPSNLPSVSVRFRASKDADQEHADWPEPLAHTAPGPPFEPPPPAPPPPDWRPWAWGIGALMVLGIVIVASRWWRRPAPVPGPKERALWELEALDGADRDPVAVHDQLAQVLRSFLSARYGVPAGQRTADELLPELTAAPGFPQDQQKRVHALLARCDAVRFSGGCTVQEAQAAVTEARQFLEQVS